MRDDPTGPTPVDPVGAAAVATGLLGIVVAGIVLAILTGVLAAIAGGRAREQRRSFDLAWAGFGLAILDGVVWIVLHYLFDLPLVVG